MNTLARFRIATVALGVLLMVGSIGDSQEDEQQDPRQSTVTAPPNTRGMGSTRGGAYFVDQELLNRYDALKVRLTQIREDILLGNATGEAAMKSLAAIDAESKQLRAQLEKRKVLVSAFQVFSKTSEQTFPLGDERLVIITGDNVVVRGWEGPGIKCVVEKVIVAKQQPADSEFDAIQVKHELTIAEDKVGLTREQRDEQEREFLNSESGKNLTREQRERRQGMVDEIHQSYDDYLVFQGRMANTIQLAGLSYQEGNRSLSLRINSPGGGGVSSSQRQRHATMTVYLPKCECLAVRGCMVGLDIQSIACDLVLTTHGSQDRDYQGSFSVVDVRGNVTVSQVPVRELSQVTGSVSLTATDEFVNSGTHHENSTRTFSPYRTHATRIDRIQGDLHASILRTELTLSQMQGTLDVVNHYGLTNLVVDKVDTERVHRIVSKSGNIHVEGSASVLEKTPIYAHTQCGRLHTNISRKVLDDVSFSTGRPRIGWKGFVTPSGERFDLAKFERPAAALDNRPRAAGLDLISNAGLVSILATPEGK